MLRGRKENMETQTEFQTYLASVGACPDAKVWAAQRSAREAWAECERADWLLWWAATAEIDRKLLVRAACACARLALRFVPAVEVRPLRAIETAEAWCDGHATIAEVNAARAAARAAEDAAGAAGAAGAAAWAAGAAAWAAWAAGAAWAAWAARAAAWAAEAAGADRAATLRQCADIVRTAYPQYPHKEK